MVKKDIGKGKRLGDFVQVCRAVRHTSFGFCAKQDYDSKSN